MLATTLFALNIGTRSVVRIILTEEIGIFNVADLVPIEHKERSMIDGQIHNIISVAAVRPSYILNDCDEITLQIESSSTVEEGIYDIKTRIFDTISAK
ncbi:hypothetical protein [Sporosarcina sp. JAI121]|uniref:hypothetical protein n=1 Tax=Sporosarcina sp. JAI121 TaxID=2723064 RepID=UPI0015CBE517|nr:hypothetical protein [Sporosarcina sp. JAI121]NYF25203.1 hypothetical protein [Sporosarcina sp. JAI121]